MHVCRTLDYIVNTDLHLYFFIKFDEARSKGIQVEIELTEPIMYLPIDSKEYINIVDLVLDDVIEGIAGSSEKKLNFYIFYACGEMHLVIEYSADRKYSCKVLDKALKKYKNAHLYTTIQGTLMRQHLVVK